MDDQPPKATNVVASDFSVVIPLWNGEATILRAVDSALSQRLAPAEIIVVDDGSSDSGPNLLRTHHPTVRLIRQENAGPRPARNAGIEAARSGWIAFLDADDVWSPAHLFELDGLRDRFPDAGLIATSHKEVPVGQILPPFPAPDRVGRRRIDYFRAAARDIGIVCSSTAAAPRCALLETGGFTSDSSGQDLAGWARLALRHPVAKSSRVTAMYVRQADSVMSRHVAKERSSPWERSTDRPSPSMRVVLEALETGDHNVSEDSLLRYLDGRRTPSWRSLLISGDPSTAKQCIAHLHHSWAPRAWPLRVVGSFHPSVWAVIVRMVARIRSR